MFNSRTNYYSHLTFLIDSWVKKDPELKVDILSKILKLYGTAALKMEIYGKILPFQQMIPLFTIANVQDAISNGRDLRYFLFFINSQHPLVISHLSLTSHQVCFLAFCHRREISFFYLIKRFIDPPVIKNCRLLLINFPWYPISVDISVVSMYVIYA